ncbi:MAG: hypothetical protein D6725_01255 [Planctomycetota bacterium]|nr:MAG: hypothetical protein D6725_01255 [Planctomycetota bacterium]
MSRSSPMMDRTPPPMLEPPTAAVSAAPPALRLDARRPGQTPRRPDVAAESAARRRRPDRVPLYATIVHAVVVGAGFWLIRVDAERTWLGTLATFAPRQLWLLPALAAMPLTIRASRSLALANAVTAICALLGLTGFSAGALWQCLDASPPAPSAQPPAKAVPQQDVSAADPAEARSTGPIRLTVASLNVQQFEGSLPTLLAELSRFNPDVITLQEAVSLPGVLREYLHPYYWVHDGEFVIAARYPLRPLGRVRVSETERQTALAALLDCHGQSIAVATLHLETPRKGFESLTPGNLLRGDAQAAIRLNTFVRGLESARTAAHLRRLAADAPLIVTGDWNTPRSSRVFEPWKDLRSTFAAAGWGFGYTAPCSPRRRWLPGLAWVRIDHILVSDHWDVARALVGTANGSDHRLVVAEVRLIR